MLTDFKVVLIDETEYWHEDIAKKAKKIWKVYFYDASEQTHCCELTPSYWLLPVTCTWDAENLDERTVDIITAEDTQDVSGRYFHCSIIDQLPNNMEVLKGNFERDGLTEQEIKDQTEEAYEWVCENIGLYIDY